MRMQYASPPEDFPKVDFMTVYPASVKTQMNSGRTLFAIPSADHAKAVIDKFTWQNETMGSWWHEW